jgi:hypothetical protein
MRVSALREEQWALVVVGYAVSETPALAPLPPA